MRTLLALTLLAPAAALAAPDLTTEAERSGFERTGRYDEVERLCRAFAAADPARVQCTTFGTTPEGRPMLALVVAGDLARAHDRPVILIQGGIHAGEIEGKDALFWTLRELLAGPRAPLDQVTLVLVPVFNVDGHERFGPNHRPNQRGPKEMGFRTTAQNLNLNRDYMKAEAPEMQALLGLWAEWDPVLLVDLHTTDGAMFEPDVALTVEPSFAEEGGLDAAVRRLQGALIARLSAQGHLPLDFYPSFKTNDDPASGFEVSSSPPRFSHGYAAARGRLGLLVETHSWKPYRVRVATTHDVLVALLARAATDAASWRAAANAADATRLGGADVVLATEPDATARPIDFRGYAYQIRKSPASNAPWIVYDETKPQLWHVPLFDHEHPSVTVHAPRGGYLVPAAHAALVAAKLRLHGLRFRPLPAAADLPVEVFRASTVTFEPPYEGRTRANLTGGWRAETQHLAPGSLFVPIDQPHARLALGLLDPTAPDSLAYWGFFNAVFEQKEYMETYVLEAEADKMLRNPAVRTDFEARLRDPKFANDPAGRLRFFYERHPAWDERLNLVPVYRTDRAP
jgi:hypothetical protein